MTMETPAGRAAAPTVLQKTLGLHVARFWPVVAVAGVLVAMVSTTAAAGVSGTAASSLGVAGIVWGRCSDPLLVQVHAQCGFVPVPLSYADPRGPQIQIAVSRIRHTSSSRDYQGVIVINPGGPGGSGLDLNTFLISALKAEGYGAAAADYDWIGFDPRGVGSSQPALSCVPGYFSPHRPSYVPSTSGLLDFWLAKSQSYAQACDGVSPVQSALLQNMTTRDAAMDMDQIRQALGQKQITYYGFSYGTYLGQVYATLFPSHLRRLILDSNINPLQNGYHAFNLNQDRPFNRNENLWFAWIATYHAVYHLGSTQAAVRHLFYATEASLAAHPAGGTIGPDEWTDIFATGPDYSQQTWVLAAQIFANWASQSSGRRLPAASTCHARGRTPGRPSRGGEFGAVGPGLARVTATSSLAPAATPAPTSPTTPAPSTPARTGNTTHPGAAVTQACKPGLRGPCLRRGIRR